MRRLLLSLAAIAAITLMLACSGSRVHEEYGVAMMRPATLPAPLYNAEEYDKIVENGFKEVISNPYSSFAIDVDGASYANVRRFLTTGQLPPPDAVRIEEMVNYFSYDYPQPSDEHPFSMTTEVSQCPWQPGHRLVHIGLQGERLPVSELPPSNLVFLIDVSGSMSWGGKLNLVKSSLRLLVNGLRKEDRVAIVTYAGKAGVRLKSTPGDRKQRIVEAIENLDAGGSTAGAAGIELAYKMARKNFREYGNNRIILITDGDFNVGVSSDDDLVKLIEGERDQGVFLSVVTVGNGNLKDSKMEKLADHGNGNYAYIDNLFEARRIFVKECGSTLYAIAKDVKLQVEFNPTRVKAYRLIGYENRLLSKEDFDDDRKDAGELGTGHTVTALYEIVPATVQSGEPYDSTRYFETRIKPEAFDNYELMTIRARYKLPDDSVSRLVVRPVIDEHIDLESTSDNFRFAAAVAEFGMVLRNSEYGNGTTCGDVLEIARDATGDDPDGYRQEFVKLVELAEGLSTELVEK